MTDVDLLARSRLGDCMSRSRWELLGAMWREVKGRGG